MSTLRSLIVPALALTVCLLTTSCPFTFGTFKYYVANFGVFSLTELNLHDSQSGNDVNVLGADVPPNTLRVMELNLVQFGGNLSALSFALSDGSTGTVNDRNAFPGFRYEVVNGQTAAGLFDVEDTAKALSQ